MPRNLSTIVLMLLATLAFGQELLAPHSLNSAFTLSHGRLWLDNEEYRDFFSEDFLPSWTFRYDHKIWKGLQLGTGVSATGKSRFMEDISLGSEEYPVRYTYTSFQYQWEIGLRLRLPHVKRLAFFGSLSAVYSGLHAETTGYSLGYEAGWSDFIPASEIRQGSWGSRASLGCSRPIWANVGILVEGSLIQLENYGEPLDAHPAAGAWNHSGMRLDVGLIQQF
ncbi:hypothetical protein H8E52_06855 [bacterium]|nr:hypothetical protein [bacterium]